MARIVKARSAESDLLEIWDYIASESSSGRADKFVDRLDGVLSLLAEQPYMGRSRDELGRTLRSHPVGNYVILYRPLDDGIVVVRVVHGHMDTEGLLEP